MPSYSEKLKDRRWITRRAEVLQKHDWKRRDCGHRSQHNQVHHCAYLPGKEPWEHGDDLLIPVCDVCHKKRQNIEDMARISLGRIFLEMILEEIEEEAWRLAGEAAKLREEKDWPEAFA